MSKSIDPFFLGCVTGGKFSAIDYGRSNYAPSWPPFTVDCFSAGTNPSEVAQGASLALTKIGVRQRGVSVKSLEPIFTKRFLNYVITLCEKSEYECRESFSDNHHICLGLSGPGREK